MKLKVLKPFTDRFDKHVKYKIGDTLHSDDRERIANLIARGLCMVLSVKPEPQSETPKAVVSFMDADYAPATMKVALEAIGIMLAKQAGVPAIIKKLGELTPDQATALKDVLTVKEE